MLTNAHAKTKENKTRRIIRAQFFPHHNPRATKKSRHPRTINISPPTARNLRNSIAKAMSTGVVPGVLSKELSNWFVSRDEFAESPAIKNSNPHKSVKAAETYISTEIILTPGGTDSFRKRRCGLFFTQPKTIISI